MRLKKIALPSSLIQSYLMKHKTFTVFDIG